MQYFPKVRLDRQLLAVRLGVRDLARTFSSGILLFFLSMTNKGKAKSQERNMSAPI